MRACEHREVLSRENASPRYVLFGYIAFFLDFKPTSSRQKVMKRLRFFNYYYKVRQFSGFIIDTSGKARVVCRQGSKLETPW
ncbi:hypothetical protein SAMN05518855_100178 [Paenibacillus sp. CF384]|nr:hypothetical protein SAMN05518855_100178 [Paenibacillus sp. CF384]